MNLVEMAETAVYNVRNVMTQKDSLAWTFREEIQQASIDLPRAALKLAREVAYSDLDVAGYLARLDDLVELAGTAVSPHDPILTQADALADFLFRQQGFRGNLLLYFDPRNSFLNAVLDRRYGIPITLSLLYVTIAGRLGLPAYGVGLPGHFIVSVRAAGQDYYFDPFHEGKRLTMQDCARLVRETTGYEFREEWLTPTEPIVVLTRMLNNLRNVYVQGQQWEEATAVIERLILVQPDDPQHLRDLGFVHYQNGVPHLAAHYLDAYLQAQPNAPDADSIQHNVGQAINAWARLN
ncbi:MAG: tetratricopeptide repeat protein [Chloroflexi bacterium]|nr:tetratricopeptide repeat protein [Chloroflexota bacterium]